ncbi:microtubule-associated tumor suppressor 1 homolog A isoform X1 [Megalobrama amblycephala]|uniref:microtubule-associated tumor suppressor 1 homolog A isoform X1 n=1 Tax=Megalobrama amblycephala TaxID=75352 RepID=UPI002013D938|nr:microtubule-associated tumor suppressor 1 homolog A isoform X1 [Megalobrama amblycephala]XP_048032025.1 microtubule-associated tumor suppressor 1 homolog A isoform X1 [Megalobrama amblycephala]
METTRRSMNLTFPVEDKNGNNITCPSEHSPDSLRSASSLSCGGTDSPPDVEMEDCITCPAKVETFSSKVVKSSGTIAVDVSKSKIDNWNENVTFLIVEPKNTECNERGSDRSSEAAPDSGERELSEVDSCEPSRRGSSDNCCSVSSGEMVMRSNSFVLHETDQPLSISLIGESRTSLDISSDLGVVSGMLPDVCEGLAEVPQGEPKNQGLESTYIQPNNQTFLIDEKSLSIEKLECVTPVHYNKSNRDVQRLACNTGGSNHSITPGEGKTVLLTASEDLDISGDAQTSTPVQSVSNKTFCLPSLSESPLNKDEGDSLSPMAQVISQQQNTASQKPKTSLMSVSKSSKIEIKRFPKPNFSNIKSKIMSRATNPFKTPKTSSSSIPQTNESQTMDQPKSSPTKSTSNAVTSTSATPAQSVKSSNAAKRTRSSTCQDSGPASKSRPRRWSESATSFKTSKDGSQEKNPQVNRVLNNRTTPQKNTKGGSQNQGGKTKPADTHESTREDVQGNESLKVQGKNQRVSLLAVSARPAAAAVCELSRGRLGPQPSPARTGGASAAHVPAANLRPPLSTSKLKPGTSGKDGSSTTDIPTPRSKLSTSDVKLKNHLTEGTSAVSVSQSRPALFATPTSASKLPVKPKVQPKSFSTPQTSGHSKQDHAEPSVGTLSKPPSNRTTLLRSKLQCPPTWSISSGCKNTPSSSSVRSSSSPLKTPTTARPMRPATTPTVDKNKSRTSSRNQQPPTNGQPDLVPPENKSRNVEYYKALCEKKNQTIQQLENTLRSNNRRFEAVAVVIKQLYTEHEEVMKQRRELSQELVTLREELVSSAHSCERLEQEKEELRGAFDGVLQKVQEQHRLDLADLEERLKTFYSTEWEKVHQTYQEEADKCKAQMEKQLEELRSKHEALKKELEVSHIEEMDGLKQHFEESFKELKQSHEKEMQTLNTTLKESEDTLSNRIQELITENNCLKEKLNAEVKRRMDLAEKTQKDSHTLYLEQELESLKVVLDIKNKQIHEQDKKLMQIDKLMERNVKLDECLKKLQQENEDLKARMDKHAALSRQLSTEQAVLQESLQKESKVNKRLSMENEELLWKLNNGDLSSPRKVSPSPSLTLQSPRNSGIFSSPPVSPR